MKTSRLSQSRSVSSRKTSLSPECQRITNRLFNSKTNKQPCPKYIHYEEMMKRIKAKDEVEDYSFIRKYLKDE